MVVMKTMAPCISEFVGTFVLVATITGNVLSGESLWGGVSWGCSLAVMIYALGKSSGGHFNPAVSLALALAGKFRFREVPLYLLSQFSGGLLAAMLVMVTHRGRGVPIGPLGEHRWWQASLVEFLYTFVLCFVVLNVAVSKRHGGNNQFYGLAIGFVVIAGAFGAGNVSGGCFNPAVAMGLDMATAIVTFKPPQWYSFAYVIFEFLGGIAATGIYFLVRPQDYVQEQSGSEPSSPLSKLLSEFLGTYVLVLTVGLNVLTGSPAASFSIACSLMCMIFALGTVSGAHFNPSVTLAVLLSGRGLCTGKEAAQYIVVQLVAGVLGARTAWLSTGMAFASLKPSHSEWTQAFVAEFLWTAVLAFVVLSVATVKLPLTEYFGFAIGMCVTVGGLAIGNLSGGSLNPAVSFGIAMSSTFTEAWHFVPYIFVELIGGVVAAGVFFATQPSEYEGLFVTSVKGSELCEEGRVVGKTGVDVEDVILQDASSKATEDWKASAVPSSHQVHSKACTLVAGPTCRCWGLL